MCIRDSPFAVDDYNVGIFSFLNFTVRWKYDASYPVSYTHLDVYKRQAEHGQIFDKDGVKFFAIYHPAALLRDQSKMPDTFVDLKNLQTLIREVAPETYENM